MVCGENTGIPHCKKAFLFFFYNSLQFSVTIECKWLEDMQKLEVRLPSKSHMLQNNALCQDMYGLVFLLSYVTNMR